MHLAWSGRGQSSASLQVQMVGTGSIGLLMPFSHSSISENTVICYHETVHRKELRNTYQTHHNYLPW